MKSQLLLKNRDGYELILPLNKMLIPYQGCEMLNIVYQDMEYEIILEIADLERTIRCINLIVHDNEIDVDTNKIATDSNKSRYLICCKNKRLFNLIYGLTEITVLLELDDGSDAYLFSGHLAVAIEKKHQQTLESVREMLDDIYQKDHALLYRSKTRNSPLFPKSLRSNNKYDEEISVLQTIYQILFKNLPYFMQAPKYQTIQDNRIDSLEKLKTIGNKNLQYIVTHPEQLKQSYGSGIYVNKRLMSPEKTLVSYSKQSYDTHENRTIISFINMLIHYLERKKEEIAVVLNVELDTISLAEPIKDDYILSTTIIQHYRKISLQNHYNSLSKLLDQYMQIFARYKNAIPSKIVNHMQIPKPTPIFLEVYHYRNVYEAIQLWYSFGYFDIPKENILLHFSSADVIYEYYCLLYLYDALLQLGYMEEVEKREAYKYQVSDPRFKNTIEDNTFYFTNNSERIILYYQPVICSDKSYKANGINLFRTDSKYYTPDFIIKHIDSRSAASYFILDAKWRNRNTLMAKDTDGGFRDTVYKYYYSVVDDANLLPCKFLWLLQGKDDITLNNTYYHNRSTISRMQSETFKKATGIVRLTPKSGMHDLIQILRVFLTA